MKKNNSKSNSKKRANNNRRKQMKKIFEMRVNFNLKNIVLWLIIIFFGFAVFSSFQKAKELFPEKPLSAVLIDLKEKRVKKIEVIDSRLLLTYQDESQFLTYKEPQESLVTILKEAGIDSSEIEIKVADTGSIFSFWNFISNVLPAILMVVFFLFLFRQARGAQDTIFSFGRSRAKLFSKKMPQATFKDVAGVDEAKKELEEVVDFLKHPKKYQALGARTPKGVLLVGPSGTGKTLLARALAGEANVPFFSMAGSEFMEMLVGVGAARTRDLFSTAKKAAPCLPGETRVTLADGQEFKIEEMFKKKMVGESVLSMGEEKIEKAKIVAITRRRFDHLLKIKTFHFKIKATPNHLFPVFWEGKIVWKEACELSSGDYLVYPQKILTGNQKISLLSLLPQDTRVYLKGENFPGQGRLKSRKLTNWQERCVSKIDFLALGKGGWTDSKLKKIPKNLNWDLAYLAGLLLADGNFSKTNRFNIGFVNTKKCLHQRVKKIIKTNFGYLPRTFLDSQSKKGAFPKRKICWVTHINNRLLRILFENLKEKLFVLLEDLIAAFISGYFDGDGYVAKKNSLPKIILSAWDKETNQLLRCLLHRIGIVPYKTISLGNIEITGKEAVEALRKKIISFHPQKRKKLAELDLQGQKSSRLDGVPIGNFLKRVRNSLGISQRDLVLGGKISEYERGIHVPSKEGLRGVLEKMEELAKKKKKNLTKELLELEKIVSGQLGFSKICQISFEQKPGFVYDLCLNNHHNFLANDLFVHNCIIFIDEIEAIGRTRSMIGITSHDEREQTLNQILVEMDGFAPNENLVVIAATNRPDLLDPALTRPGRFDRRIVLDFPDIEGRGEILKIHARGKPFADSVNWDKVAKRTVGFSGADLENMLNEAAILAASEEKKAIDMDDLEEAATKVKLGPEKKRLQSDFDKKITAYHEAGHAVVTHQLPHMDPVHRVSIVSRGLALGFTLIPPQKDRTHETRSHLLEQITAMMGGRLAEELVFQEMTSGAASDFDQATQVAREMVIEFGMSTLGPINFGPTVQSFEWGRNWYEQAPISDQMRARIDKEIKKIIDGCYKRAEEILTKKREKLDLVAQELIKKENLDGEEFEKLMGYPKKKIKD